MAYANGMAPPEALCKFEGVLLTPDMYRRVVWAFAEYRRRGGKIKANQGYRFRGTLADYAVGFNDRSEDEAGAAATSDGTANQNYQSGRAALYRATFGKFGTPSAATVGASPHGDWLVGALDCDADNTALRDEVFRIVGLVRNIRGETWHYANVAAPTIDLSGIPLPGEEPERKDILLMANSISIHYTTDNTWFIYTPLQLRQVGEAHARNLAKAQDNFILELEGDQIVSYRQQVEENIRQAQFVQATTPFDVSDDGGGSEQTATWVGLRNLYRKLVLGK